MSEASINTAMIADGKIDTRMRKDVSHIPEQTPAPKMVLVISGGCLQTVHVSKGFPEIDLVLVDHDNLDCEGHDGDAIEAREIADCPNVMVPDLPEEEESGE